MLRVPYAVSFTTSAKDLTVTFFDPCQGLALPLQTQEKEDVIVRSG
jgi:hypothetical protein